MPTFGQIVIAALLTAACTPTIISGIRAWWQAEKDLAARATRNHKDLS